MFDKISTLEESVRTLKESSIGYRDIRSRFLDTLEVVGCNRCSGLDNEDHREFVDERRWTVALTILGP